MDTNKDMNKDKEDRNDRIRGTKKMFGANSKWFKDSLSTIKYEKIPPYSKMHNKRKIPFKPRSSIRNSVRYIIKRDILLANEKFANLGKTISVPKIKNLIRETQENIFRYPMLGITNRATNLPGIEKIVSPVNGVESEHEPKIEKKLKLHKSAIRLRGRPRLNKIVVKEKRGGLKKKK